MSAVCAEFVAEAFAVRTAAHLAHLSAKTYAIHIALNEFYDEMLEQADRFAEVAKGVGGKPIPYPSKTPPDHSDPIALLENFEDCIEEYAEKLADIESLALNNILAELLAVTQQALYKLRFLK
jgi:DNA-binding ferritin-like protein